MLSDNTAERCDASAGDSALCISVRLEDSGVIHEKLFKEQAAVQGLFAIKPVL